MPCSPLIEVFDLENASIQYINQKPPLKPLITVAEYPVPIEWSFLMNKKGELSARFENKLQERSQDLPKSYFDTGTFMIFPKECFYEKEVSIHNEYISYKISKFKSLDIDDYEDWQLAESIFFHKNKKNN